MRTRREGVETVDGDGKPADRRTGGRADGARGPAGTRGAATVGASPSADRSDRQSTARCPFPVPVRRSPKTKHPHSQDSRNGGCERRTPPKGESRPPPRPSLERQYAGAGEPVSWLEAAPSAFPVSRAAPQWPDFGGVFRVTPRASYSGGAAPELHRLPCGPPASDFYFANEAIRKQGKGKRAG